jgi:hypothetical protein
MASQLADRLMLDLQINISKTLLILQLVNEESHTNYFNWQLFQSTFNNTTFDRYFDQIEDS